MRGDNETSAFVSTCSPPRPHSPQDDGQLIFHVDVAGRRDSQVSRSVAAATTGTELICADVGTFATSSISPSNPIDIFY